MFEFQNLEVYKKAKAFYNECRKLIVNSKLDNYVKDQLGRDSFSDAIIYLKSKNRFKGMDYKHIN